MTRRDLKIDQINTQVIRCHDGWLLGGVAFELRQSSHLFLSLWWPPCCSGQWTCPTCSGTLEEWGPCPSHPCPFAVPEGCASPPTTRKWLSTTTRLRLSLRQRKACLPAWSMREGPAGAPSTLGLATHYHWPTGSWFAEALQL